MLRIASNILHLKVGELQYTVKNIKKIWATLIPRSFIVLLRITLRFAVLKVHDGWWSWALHAKAEPAARQHGRGAGDHAAQHLAGTRRC